MAKMNRMAKIDEKLQAIKDDDAGDIEAADEKVARNWSLLTVETQDGIREFKMGARSAIAFEAALPTGRMGVVAQFASFAQKYPNGPNGPHTQPTARVAGLHCGGPARMVVTRAGGEGESAWSELVDVAISPGARLHILGALSDGQSAQTYDADVSLDGVKSLSLEEASY